MRRFLLFAALAGFASSAQAQFITGRVSDRTSGFPVAGVVVAGVDASGTPLARTVTDSASGYRIPLLPGMARLTFRRIGYSPAEAALGDSANGRIDVVMTRLPTKLPPVKALVAAQCDEKANQPDVLALWEQARSGLLTSMVARESKAGYTSVLVYQADFKGDDQEPQAVERIELPPGVAQPFGTGGDPETLVKTGYLVREGFTQYFIAPDDRVLFDESFLASHCFTADSSRIARDSLIGIRFESGKGARVVGVEGTLWLRLNPLDLASIDYSYTNLSRAMARVRPGGSVHLKRMPNGITMIAEWTIRGAAEMTPRRASPGAPIAVTAGSRPGAIRSPARVAPRDAVATAVEMGAVIEMMQWPDTPPYVAPLATVSGTVTDQFSKKPLANTAIRFYRTPFATTTDSTGAFTLIDVLPGVYEIDAGDAELEEYGAASRLIGPIAIKYGPNTLALEAEGPFAVVVRGCGEKVDGRLNMPKQFAGNNAVFGRLTFENRPPGEANIRAEVSLAGAVAGTAAFPLKGKTDKFGRFRICGLPAGKVRINGNVGSVTGSEDLTIDPARPYDLITIKLTKPAKP